ncbi:MAG: alanine racemase [Phycisphaerales bacterium]|nr:alanine racemase [Phycisphaerales bacterium]
MRDTSTITVNLSAIDRNMAVLRSIVGPDCGLCPIVKADAYGLGAARVGKRLVQAGADMLAVYSPEQASALTRAAISCPVLVLMPIAEVGRTDELYRWLVSGQLHLTVHDAEHLAALHRLAEQYGAVLPLHVEVDSGLSRGGSRPEDATRMIERIASTRWLRLAGVFTHFSHSRTDPERTQRQLDVFDAMLEACASAVPADCTIHVASTHSLLRHPRFHRAMVRFGLAWAGYGMEDLEGGEIIVEGEQLEPAVTWSSRIVQVKEIEAGTSVGYGGLWTATRRTVLGLVPVGYADGFPPTTAAGRGKPPAKVAVVLNLPAGTVRHYASVVGAVNMDQISIDLTDVMDLGGGPSLRVGVGTTVEIVSPDRRAPNHLPKLAGMAGSIPHDLLCRLGHSIRRQYVSDAAQPGAVRRTTAVAG